MRNGRHHPRRRGLSGGHAAGSAGGPGAYRVDSIDPSGSGDAFAAGVVTGILRQWDMAKTLRYAAALGASATTAIGTTDGVFTAEQAQAFIEQHPLTVNGSEWGQ